MLKNGASGTPSGLSTYLPYLKNFTTEPHLRRSSTRFSGITKAIFKYLGLNTVLMTLSPELFLYFETDIFAQDFRPIFGLDRHLAHGCSSDE